MHKKCLAIVLLVIVLGGCQDFKKKHPDFPNWGWWDKKQTPTTQPTSASAPQQDTDQTAKPADNVDTPKDFATPTPEVEKLSDTETPPTGPIPVKPAPLPEPPSHRSEVWKHVSKLRNLEEYSDDEQKKMIVYAQENLQEWYKPLDVASPDMSKSDWVIVMIWDFMPPADFQKAAENWKKIAEAQKVEFPKNLTRRKLMKFVLKMQDRKP